MGRGPGEQVGRCLLGMAAGVPLTDVLSVMCGGGVEVREGSGGARATMVAIVADERGRLQARLICSRMMQWVTENNSKRICRDPGNRKVSGKTRGVKME
jgi:hypothetical protein